MSAGRRGRTPASTGPTKQRGGRAQGGVRSPPRRASANLPALTSQKASSPDLRRTWPPYAHGDRVAPPRRESSPSRASSMVLEVPSPDRWDLDVPKSVMRTGETKSSPPGCSSASRRAIRATGWPSRRTGGGSRREDRRRTFAAGPGVPAPRAEDPLLVAFPPDSKRRTRFAGRQHEARCHVRAPPAKPARTRDLPKNVDVPVRRHPTSDASTRDVGAALSWRNRAGTG